MPKAHGYATSPPPLKLLLLRCIPSEEESFIYDGGFTNPFRRFLIEWKKGSTPRISCNRAVDFLKEKCDFYIRTYPEPRNERRYYTPPPLYSNLESILPCPPAYGQIADKKPSLFQKILRNKSQKSKAQRKLEECEKSLRTHQERLYTQAFQEKSLWEKLISQIRAIEPDADNYINISTCANIFEFFLHDLNMGVKAMNDTESKLEKFVTQRFCIINNEIDRGKEALEKINATITQKTEEISLLLDTEETILLGDKNLLITESRRNKKINQLQQEIDHLTQEKISFEDQIAFFLIKKVQSYPFEKSPLPAINGTLHPSLILPKFSEYKFRI